VKKESAIKVDGPYIKASTILVCKTEDGVSDGKAMKEMITGKRN
jgi:hypothetical protein